MKKMHASATIWRTLAILIVLVLASAYLTSYLAARFTSSGGDDDGARVARFDVAAKKKNDVPLSIDLDFYDPEKQSDSFEFEVISSSEVSSEYDVVLILPGQMTDLVADGVLIVKMDGSSTGTVDTANKSITFEGGSFQPSTTQSYSHTITLEIKTGTMPSFSFNITDPATLRIHAEQID